MDAGQETELDAAVFRRLLRHFDERNDVGFQPFSLRLLCSKDVLQLAQAQFGGRQVDVRNSNGPRQPVPGHLIDFSFEDPHASP